MPKFYLNVINTADESNKERFDLASLEEAKDPSNLRGERLNFG